MDITHLDIDQLISVRVRAQVVELPNKIKRFELKQNQNTLYNSFSVRNQLANMKLCIVKSKSRL